MPVLRTIASFISLDFCTKKITYYVLLFITIDLLISLVVLAKLKIIYTVSREFTGRLFIP